MSKVICLMALQQYEVQIGTKMLSKKMDVPKITNSPYEV
jgi:hypothetical protein